jgi:DNA-directed RNA polymerase specialized sigma24 family protein
METLYARTEHGGHRVVPLRDSSGFKVEWPHGARTYPSARQTIIALVNRDPSPPVNAYDPHLTFDRYFRRGDHQRQNEPSVDVFDLFRPSPGIAVATPKVQLKPSNTLTVFEPEPEPLKPEPEPLKPEKGFDMEARALEVRKLFYAGFARKVIRMGYDPEDVLQEVYMGLLARNDGKCPFDASKSSFGHYVHMVCGCIVSNYRRRYGRIERNEVYGVTTPDNEVVDVAEADLVSVDAAQEDEAVLLSAHRVLAARVESAALEAGFDARLAVRCLAFLAEGRRNKDITEATKASPTLVSKLIKLVREVARGFQSEVVYA